LQASDFYALAEQVAGGWGPDVLTLQRPSSAARGPAEKKMERAKRKREPTADQRNGGVALADSPPKLRFRIQDEKRWYAAKKKAVTIRHVSEHKMIAVLEILSPGNKASRGDLDDLLRKAHDLLRNGIHFGVVDLFPPTRRDPEGIHPLIWGDDDDGIFQFDPSKPLTCASYRAGPTEAFIEPVGIGDKLPELPLFLIGDAYVPVPLERAYQAAFAAMPSVWSEALKG
jgi:hypothetical protein